jgi:hypothetical protein
VLDTDVDVGLGVHVQAAIIVDPEGPDRPIIPEHPDILEDVVQPLLDAREIARPWDRNVVALLRLEGYAGRAITLVDLFRPHKPYGDSDIPAVERVT